ncbi:MAG TPA: hypothetical protein PLU35_02955 [Phycisphaerales bacterium]|nr:hypothetical protein [Phycisphaerales bacterium]
MLRGCQGDLLEFVGGRDGGVEEAQSEGALDEGFKAVEFVVDGRVLAELDEVGGAEVAGDGEGAHGEAEAGEEVEEGGES